MNHLAHLALAPAAPLVRLGNLLGDFVRGVDLSTLPPPVRQGIAQHRAVDRFTDAHAEFRRSRARVRPALRRWSSVLVDVFYDHFLARGWERHGTGTPLPVFTTGVYDLLRRHDELLPSPMRRVLPRMIANDWLAACADVDGVRAVLSRIARRARRPVDLAAGAGDLAAHYEGFAADFERFFPEVAAFAVAYRPSNSDARSSCRGPSSSHTA